MSQNPNLTPEVTPDLLDPHPLAPFPGDLRDDDGQAIDDYFRSGETGPPAESEGIRTDVEKIPKATRVVHTQYRNSDINVNARGFQIIPADLNRKSLYFESAVTFYWSGENFSSSAESYSGSSAYVNGVWYRPSLGVIELAGYTGPLFVAGSDESLALHVWAITT